MLSVDEALALVLEHIDIIDAEERPLLDCLGQVLARDIVSALDIPPADNAAKDGYAVRSADTRGASPKSPRVLRVIDTIGAGAVSQAEVAPGTAVRIMTGAPLPPGADGVVKFEDTDESERTGTPREIGIRSQIEPDTELKKRGEDITAGSLVLPQGTVIRPAEVGVLASLGLSRVPVIRRPTVAVIATGDEVVDIAEALPPGKIYNSNSYSVSALVRHYGGTPQLLGVAPDQKEALRQMLRLGAESDMVLTTGGVSLGDYDVVRQVLAEEGEIVFWRVRQKPGKPLVFGMLKGKGADGGAREIPLFGLAGNPVSSMVNFELFVRPAILKMMGKAALAKPTVEAELEAGIENDDGRRVFARAVVTKCDGRYRARLTGPQGSGILTSMALANGLVIVPEDRRRVAKGETVTVMMLDWPEEVA